MKTKESKPRGLNLRKKYGSGNNEISLNFDSKNICHIERRFSVQCSRSPALSFFCSLQYEIINFKCYDGII